MACLQFKYFSQQANRTSRFLRCVASQSETTPIHELRGGSDFKGNGRQLRMKTSYFFQSVDSWFSRRNRRLQPRVKARFASGELPPASVRHHWFLYAERCFVSTTISENFRIVSGVYEEYSFPFVALIAKDYMSTRQFSDLLCLALLWGTFAGSSASAREILIGQVVGYTSATAKQANESRLGASVLIEAVNARGGVNGDQLRLITADDNYKPAETVKQVASMIGKVSALLPLIGSENYRELIKSGVLDKTNVPILGIIPSNTSMRANFHKNVFHFKGGDTEQLNKVVKHLTTVGIKKIGVIGRDNPSSKEATADIQAALKLYGAPPAEVVTYDIKATNFGPQVKFMQDKRPDAIILLGITQSIAAVTKALKEGGVSALLYTMGNADPVLIWEVVGPQARGFGITQVFPNMRKTAFPLVKSFREDFAKYSKTTEAPTPYNFEGYIAARLIVEAIRKSKDSSPEGVKKGLEQMRDFDLGGHVVNFSPTNHVGSNWADIAILDSSGALLY